MAKKKRELWPIGIVAALSLFIGGIVLSVTIMMRNDVPLVSPDYYEKELAYQNQIDKMESTLSEGMTPELEFLSATGGLQVDFPGVETGTRVEGTMTFFRPSDPDLDFTVKVSPDAKGQQWVDLRSARNGLWQLKIDWVVDGTKFYHQTDFEI